MLRLVGAFVILLAAAGGGLPAQAAEPSAARYFPETTQLVVGPFRAFVEQHGPDFLGPPLTGSYVEDGRLAQWFRNGRLELRGGLATLAELGQELLDPDGVEPTPAPDEAEPGLAYFPETGQTVGHAILAFYAAHGGPSVLGLPLTPEEEGVQWFERARLDWDPSTSRVRLGPLGQQRLAENDLAPGAFATRWVATHLPSPFRSLEGEEVGEVSAWRNFLMLGHEGDWLRVWDPLQDRFGFIEAGAAGLVEPPGWHTALASASRINLDGRAVNLRREAPELDGLRHNTPETAVLALADGPGEPSYLTDSGYVLPSRALRLPRPADVTFSGKWIDADLAEPVLITAYEDDRPVYSALAVKGVVAFSTPTGVFRILRRVADETMDSATIGIPRNAPGGYYLKGVLFTQYFSGDGAALHYNYWRSDWGYAGSHGCLGMNYADSLWFWHWAETGTPVYVHH